jgi:hypothetical protein
VHLVGFTIEIYYDARPYKRQILSSNSSQVIPDVHIYLSSCNPSDAQTFWGDSYIFGKFVDPWQLL